MCLYLGQCHMVFIVDICSWRPQLLVSRQVLLRPTLNFYLLHLSLSLSQSKEKRKKKKPWLFQITYSFTFRTMFSTRSVLKSIYNLHLKHLQIEESWILLCPFFLVTKGYPVRQWRPFQGVEEATGNLLEIVGESQ